MAAYVYGYTLFYRSVAEFLHTDGTLDLRPVDQLPRVQAACQPTEALREQALLKDVVNLESPRQGYRVERVERFRDCAQCEGTGKLRVRPKGWRKKTPPPWWACTPQDCGDCAGQGREVESTMYRVPEEMKAEVR